ncbi:MAG TPA: DUF4010 domain-containing protein [Ktedonobacteraceae bacterium]
MDTFAQFALKIAASAGIGLLIGLEREWAHKDAGVRTFALVSLLGTCAWLVSPTLAFAQFSLVVLVILLINGYAAWKQHGLQITTSVALAIANVLGIALGGGNFFLAFAGTVAVTALLSWKTELITLSGKLTEAEIRGALLLVFISVVVYPLLPSQTIDPWHILNARSVWLTVILVSSLQFLNYILLRMFGHRGILYSALLGGLVNSAAISLFLGQDARTDARIEAEAPGDILLADTAMIFRNWLLVLLFSLPLNWRSSLSTVIILLPMMLLAAAMAGLALWRTRQVYPSRPGSRAVSGPSSEPPEPGKSETESAGRQQQVPESSTSAGAPAPLFEEETQVELGETGGASMETRPAQPDQRPDRGKTLKSPLALRSVCGFGLLFLSLTVASGAAKFLFGSFGFLVVIVVGALASAASSAVLVGQELAQSMVGGMPAAIAMFLATVVGLLENVVIFWLVARKPLVGLRSILLTLPVIAVGVLLVIVMRVL